MDADSNRKELKERERKLIEKEEKTSIREKEGLQNLLEDHLEELESKRQGFELELERERRSFDENMVQRQADLLNREKDAISLVAELSKKKTKDWQNDLDAESKALKRWEESLKNDEKRLMEEKQHIDKEKQQIDMSISELERIRLTLEAEKEKILEVQNNLKVTEEERQQHKALTENLKKEIEEYRVRSNSLSAELDESKRLQQKFKKRFHRVDKVKKANIIERTNLERWRDSEEKKLNDAKLEMEENYKELMENLERKEKDLNDAIKQKQMEIDELLKAERADLQRKLQLHRHELEMEMERKQATKEKELEDKENELNKKMDFVENKVRHAIELNESKIQKIISEKRQLQTETKILLEERQKLETDKADIKRDIDSLHVLRQSLKLPRESYNKDRNNVIDLFEKYKVCKNCGISLFEGSDSLLLNDTAEIEHPSLAVEIDDHSLSADTSAPDTGLAVERHDRSLNADTSARDTGTLVNSGGPLSLFQKCSRLFKFSPIKKGEQPAENIPFGARLEEASQSDEDYEPTPVYEIARGSIGAEDDLPSESEARENDDLHSGAGRFPLRSSLAFLRPTGRCFGSSPTFTT